MHHGSSTIHIGMKRQIIGQRYGCPTGGGLKHIGGIIGLFGGTRSNKRSLLWQNGPLSLAQDLEQNNNKDAYSGYLNEAWKTWCR